MNRDEEPVGAAMGARRTSRGRTALIVVAASLVAVGALGALGLYLAPGVLPNINTSVADADLEQSLTVDGASATVVVPAGWAYHRAWGEPAQLVVRSPDGLLSATMTVTRMPAADAFAAQAEAASSTGDSLGGTARETLASGLETYHADAPATGVFVAAVGSGSSPSVQLLARGPADHLDAYRASLAGLLETVRTGS